MTDSISSYFGGPNNSCAVVGAQWGDEGKGKITDVLSEKANLVVRWQGGPNAGHTVVVDGKKHVTHGFPSGLLREDVLPVIARGCVVDPLQLVQESDDLGDAIKSETLVDERATLITPWHRKLDALQEESGDSKIGTTKSGIGPAYASRASRVALTVGDVKTSDLESKLADLREWMSHLVIGYGNIGKMRSFRSASEMAKDLKESLSTLEKRDHVRVGNASKVVNMALDGRDRVLFEGAQGTMLDVLHGMYPNVTSSSPTASGIPSGVGIPCDSIDHVVGVTKAYTTRVGSGSFPCEQTMSDDVRNTVREVGGEYGATTGRPRRCGWLDLPALSYASSLNGFDSLVVSKVDVLAELDTVRMLSRYRNMGRAEDVPNKLDEVSYEDAMMETFKGWSPRLVSSETSYDSVKSHRSDTLLRFLDRIEDETDVPVDILSVGPDRKDTIIDSVS
jgi:adenylosuccinate synthase